MMKKKQRNIRRRLGDSDEEANTPKDIPFLEEEDYHTQVKKVVEERAAKKKVKEKKSEKKQKDGSGKTSLLSFGEEEEEASEVFQVKKSSMSRRMAKTKEKMKKKKDQAKVQTGEEATTEASLPDKVDSPQPERKLKRPDFCRNKDEDIILNGMDAEAAVMAVDDQKELGDGLRRIASGLIPDATMIHAARKKRQMAREFGSDYVSLDDTQRFRGNKSRLVRDDDNDRSGSDSDEGRMSFTVKQSTKRERVQEAMQPVVQHESGSDQDEEFERWEQEQIKKGISVPQTQGSAEGSPYQQLGYQQEGGMEMVYGVTSEQAWYGAPYAADPTEQKPYIPPDASNLPVTFPTITMQDLKKRLSDRLEPLDEVHRAHERDYENIVERMKNSALSSVELKDSTGGVSGQYEFFQEMRAYIRDLVECLNEKVPTINSLEDAMLNLHKNRAAYLVQRRQGDIKDQSVEFMSHKAAAGANMAMKRSKAEREEKQKNRRAAEREARRSRRRRTREGKVKLLNHYEGLSSDDEQTESQRAQFSSERERISGEVKGIFEDVVDDFHALPVIQSKFEKWKHSFSDSYNEAYVGLCLSKLYNPFIRLALIDWNPLESGCPSIESLPWFNTLLFYGYQEAKELSKEDSDIKLIPTIVDKIILPKLIALVENVWDPMSTTQTHRLAETIQMLAEDYPTVSSLNKNTQALLQAIVTRMRKTLDDDVYMPLYPKSMLEQKGAMAFMQRQFWTCVKLLGNILCWHGLVDQQVLMEIAVDGLLNRYLLLSLQNSDVDETSLAKCQKIVSVIPKQWFQDLQGDSTLSQLEPFCKYQLNCVDTLHTIYHGGSDTQKKAAKSQIKQVTKLLVSIHAMDHALSVTSDYSLKDLKKILD